LLCSIPSICPIKLAERGTFGLGDDPFATSAKHRYNKGAIKEGDLHESLAVLSADPPFGIGAFFDRACALARGD
jgi:hypothetical protein